jgi:dihydrofolate reductase
MNAYMLKQKKFSLILASMFDGGIGIDNEIPWYVPEEFKKFKEITSEVQNTNKINAIVMGRNTWESLPKRPLPNRVNIIISNDMSYKTPYRNVIVLHSLMAVIMYCNSYDYIENIFIIGGASIYNQILFSDYFSKKIYRIYLSVMFYNSSQQTANKFIDIQHLLTAYNVQKDEKYKQQSDDRYFASFICTPKHLT